MIFNEDLHSVLKDIEDLTFYKYIYCWIKISNEEQNEMLFKSACIPSQDSVELKENAKNEAHNKNYVLYE